MRDRVSLSDVALLAGVSTATASRALRGVRGVAPATRTRVCEAASALDYAVDPEASRLATRRRARCTARRIGILFPQDAPLWWACARAAYDALDDAGHEVVLLPAHGEPRAALGRLARDRAVDAAIVAGVVLPDHERARLESAGLVVVTVGHATDSTFDVRVSAAQCRRVAVEHLAALGHRRVVRLRLAGSSVAPEEGGSPGTPGVDVVAREVIPTAEGVRSAVAALRAGGDRALWVESAELSLAVLTYLRCPPDSSHGAVDVVGLGDGTSSAELADLTTVHLRPVDLGSAAAAMLVATIRGDHADYGLHLAPRLVIRGSTRGSLQG